MDDIQTLQKQLKLMQDRLIEEGNRIPNEPLVVEFDNGGGQSGIRENPFYPAYEKLLSSYIKTMTCVKGEGDASGDLTTLDDFRNFKIVK